MGKKVIAILSNDPNLEEIVKKVVNNEDLSGIDKKYWVEFPGEESRYKHILNIWEDGSPVLESDKQTELE